MGWGSDVQELIESALPELSNDVPSLPLSQG
jgi:hypothetical protein